MFSNHYTLSVDDNGRLMLPARWREELGSAVVVTRGLDQCLFVFPAEKFEFLAQQMKRLAFSKSDARTLSRYLFAEAFDNPPDEQGRIALTPTLRAFAELDIEATVVGVNDRIEIWNPQRYVEADARIEAEAFTVAERMGEALQIALVKNTD
jgi:MraZ protein